VIVSTGSVIFFELFCGESHGIVEGVARRMLDEALEIWERSSDKGVGRLERDVLSIGRKELRAPKRFP
jgi:hypothetical protein